MSKSSRRKTLSHSEIENFLSDLALPKETLETIQEPFAVDGPSLKSPNTVCITPSCFGEPEEIGWIREFCKLKFDPVPKVANDVRRKEIGLNVLKTSNYKILPLRTLKPEQFHHPASSLEGKKALLLSLSPMLTDNETQRKLDVAACENSTRCKSAKGKSRVSTYEYFDVDNGDRVDFEEFERRYLAFVLANKPGSYTMPVDNSSSSSSSTAAASALPDKVHDLMDVYNLETPSVYVKEVSIKKKSEIMSFESTVNKENVANMSSAALTSSSSSASSINEMEVKPKRALGTVNDRKRKNVTSSSERRVTLSPATARAMMLKAFEEDEPTVFKAVPVIDYDLGSNSMVSPSRLLIREFKAPDLFSNPSYIDCNDEDDTVETPASSSSSSHLAVKLFIDELPVGNATAPSSSSAAVVAPAEEAAAAAPAGSVEAEEAQPSMVVVDDFAPAPEPTVSSSEDLDDLLSLSDCLFPATSRAAKSRVRARKSLDSVAVEDILLDLDSSPAKPAAPSTASLASQAELNTFRQELDGILADGDFCSPVGASEPAPFAFPVQQQPPVDVTPLPTVSSPTHLTPGIGSLDVLLNGSPDVIPEAEQQEQQEDVVLVDSVPSLEFLASVACRELGDRPSSAVEMSEEVEEVVVAVEGELPPAEAEAEASPLQAATAAEELQSHVSTDNAMLGRDDARNVLHEAFSALRKDATDLETFELIERLIEKADSERATPVTVDSKLYAFCNNTHFSPDKAIVKMTETSPVSYDDDEEYPYFRPLDAPSSSEMVMASGSGEIVVETSSSEEEEEEEVGMTVDTPDTPVVVEVVPEEQPVEASSSVEAETTTLPVASRSSEEEPFYPEPQDYSLAQERAYKLRLQRFEIARNKYQWELVSVKAANAAIERAKQRANANV